MSTHAETIQVPAGWTIDELSGSHLGEHTKAMVCYLKPLPPPEPPIDSCRYCGAAWSVSECLGWFTLWAPHADGCMLRCLLGAHTPKYSTRLAAIQAANRRA